MRQDTLESSSSDLTIPILQQRSLNIMVLFWIHSNGKAYVCTCAQEDIRQMRAKGLACAHRTNSVEENLKLWEKMKKKEFKRNEAVLRFLGDIKSSNTAMRDPVLFRIVEDPHPLRGTKYHIWPTYDFDGPVEDSLDGVTHAMRS